jgi:cytochrome b subunit of formate dehydrogenase
MSRPELPRFTGGQRWVHHATAVLLFGCLATAAMLYVGPLAAAVGNRTLIKTLHLVAGFALPVPVLLGVLSAAFRADLRRLNRFHRVDWEWLRDPERRAILRGRGLLEVGKFNAGQKLNAAFIGGAIAVMLGTGAMLTFPDPWPDQLRTGATFVHDWLTLAVVVVVSGHLVYALRDPGALRGIWTGHVTRDWAARDHPAWLDELDESTESDELTERDESTEPGESTKPDNSTAPDEPATSAASAKTSDKVGTDKAASDAEPGKS